LSWKSNGRAAIVIEERCFSHELGIVEPSTLRGGELFLKKHIVFAVGEEVSVTSAKPAIDALGSRDPFDSIDCCAVTPRCNRSALRAVESLESDEAVVERARQVRRAPPRLASSYWTVVEHDHAFAAEDELIGRADSRNACTDYADVDLGYVRKASVTLVDRPSHP
jgi:hypothetical protein